MVNKILKLFKLDKVKNYMDFFILSEVVDRKKNIKLLIII